MTEEIVSSVQIVTYFMSNLPAELVPEETTPGETVPGTGDTNNISILLFLLLFSGCALAAVVTIGHKKKKSRKN